MLKTQSDGTRAISLYDDTLSDRGVSIGLKKLQVAFPRQNTDFFNLLAERLVANGFTDKRLQDAVNAVIDNFQYKELNISDILKFDKTLRLYTYNEAITEMGKRGTTFADFPIYKEINGRKYRAYIGDIDRILVK